MHKLHYKTGIAAAIALAAQGALTPQYAVGANTLEEVIVTARKKDESLQDVSAALSVVGSTRLLENNIVDVRDLQNVVPNLTVGEAVGMMKINMRGLSNSTTTRNEDSEVVMHVDGAVISRMEAQSLAFFDLERVEVLRGPQGTLYGRNSTGGTINLITAKPTEELSGYINATVGNYNLTRVEGAIAGPLTDRTRGRLAIQKVSRDGYGRNIADGNDYNDDNRWAARAHLQFLINDDIDFLLTGEYASQNDSSGHLSYLGQRYDDDPAPAPGTASSPTSRDGSFSVQPQMERETFAFTGTLNWNLSENLSLRSITNYRDLDFFQWTDLDVTTVNFVDTGLPMKSEQVSQELQLTYQNDNLYVMGGLFYFKETFSGRTDVFIRPSSLLFQFVGDSETEALSPFWNARYDLNDSFTLRAGGRLNDEDRDIRNASGANGNLVQSVVATDSKSFSEYTGEYGIDYRFNENTLLYYTFSQGFRSGAALLMQVDSPIIDPTTVDNHEIGIKYSSDDGRFIFNLAAFDATVEDLQRSQATTLVDENGNTVGAGLRINNINELDTSGVEVDMQWSPVDQLLINLNFANITAEFQDFVTDDPLIRGDDFIQVAGNTPRLTPEWKGNLRVAYDFLDIFGGSLTARMDVSYVGKQYFDEFNRAPFVENGYSLLAGGLTYRPASENWWVSLWGNNLTAEDAIYDTNFSALGGIRNKFLVNPRTFGITANFSF
jgi:iron complex outermembrane receptor protein